MDGLDGYAVLSVSGKRIQVGEINRSLFYVDADVEYLGRETVEVPYGKLIVTVRNNRQGNAGTVVRKKPGSG